MHPSAIIIAIKYPRQRSERLKYDNFNVVSYSHKIMHIIYNILSVYCVLFFPKESNLVFFSNGLFSVLGINNLKLPAIGVGVPGAHSTDPLVD